MSGIYVASKTKHGSRWRRCRIAGAPIISTWIDESDPGETVDWPDLWRRCVKEASECDTLILYLQPGEALKGALVEVGCALSHGKPVLYVGPDDTYSVLKHTLVTRCTNLREAFDRAGWSGS